MTPVDGGELLGGVVAGTNDAKVAPGATVSVAGAAAAKYSSSVLGTSTTAARTTSAVAAAAHWATRSGRLERRRIGCSIT